MDEKTLGELEALLAKATPGPWHRCGASEGKCACGLLWVTSEKAYGIQNYDDGDRTPHDDIAHANTDVMVAARNALPALIAAARKGADDARRLGEIEAACARLDATDQEAITGSFAHSVNRWRFLSTNALIRSRIGAAWSGSRNLRTEYAPTLIALLLKLGAK